MFLFQFLELFFVLPVEFLFIDEATHKVVDFLLKFLEVRDRTFSGTADVRGGVAEYLIYFLFGRNLNLESLWFWGLVAIDGIVVPNLEIVLDAVAGIEQDGRKIGRIVKLLRRVRTDCNRLTISGWCGILYITFLYDKFQTGEAVVILNLAAEEVAFGHCGIVHLHDNNHGGSILDNRDRVGEGVGRGTVAMSQERVWEWGHCTALKTGTTTGREGNRRDWWVDDKRERFGIASLKNPFNASTFRNSQIALTNDSFRLTASVGGVGEESLEISYSGTRNDVELVGTGNNACRAELQSMRALQVFEEIREMSVVTFLHLIADAIDEDGNIVRYFVTFDGETNREIILLWGGKGVILKNKRERCRTLVICWMVDDTTGWFSDKRGSNDKSHNDEEERNSDIFHISQVLFEVDGIEEWDRGEESRFLLNTGSEKILADARIGNDVWILL